MLFGMLGFEGFGVVGSASRMIYGLGLEGLREAGGFVGFGWVGHISFLYGWGPA